MKCIYHRPDEECEHMSQKDGRQFCSIEVCPKWSNLQQEVADRRKATEKEFNLKFDL